MLIIDIWDVVNLAIVTVIDIVQYKHNHDHITPTFMDIYWQAVEKCIMGKVLRLTRKCQNDPAPKCLSELVMTLQTGFIKMTRTFRVGQCSNITHAGGEGAFDKAVRYTMEWHILIT